MVTSSRTVERRANQRLNAAALTARGEHHRAKGLIHCVLEDERREVTGYRTWRCQQRHCLFCCRRYSQRLTRKYARKIERLMGNDYRVSLLTLTVPNTPSLSPKLYKWLAINLKRLLRRHPFIGRVVGAVARIETDFNSDSQDFHPHIHVILIYKQCISQREIAEAWRDLTSPQPNDYALSDVPGCVSQPCIVWIEKIAPEAIREKVGYLFKFKPFKDAEAFAEYDCAVRNVRLVQTYGALRGRFRKA
jgi:hypothetical protein